MKFLRVTGSGATAEKYNQGYKMRGTEVHGDVLKVQDVYYDAGFKYLATKEPIPLYDVYWVGGLQGIYKTMVSAFIYYYGTLQGRCFLDTASKSHGMYTKVLQQIVFDHNGYPSLKTMAFCLSSKTKTHVSNIITESFNFPIVLKNPSLDRGLGVEKINTQQELEIYINDVLSNKMEKCVIVQEFYPASCDYRALVLGDKILGVVSRSNPTSFKHNISQGGIGAEVSIPQSIELLLIKATKSVGLDVGGVDFFRDGKSSVLLIEINRMPQYAGFEQSTGKDFLSLLTDFLIQKNINA